MIRPATAEDYDELHELFSLGEKEFVGAPVIFQNINSTFRDIRVDEENGVIRGMLTVRHNDYGPLLVGSLFVHPEHRGNGVAKALLDSVPAPADVLLWDGSSVQKQLYEAAGFQPIGTLMEKR